MALRCLKCWKLPGSRSAMSWNAPHFYRHPISNATFKLLGCTKSQSCQVGARGAASSKLERSSTPTSDFGPAVGAALILGRS